MVNSYLDHGQKIPIVQVWMPEPPPPLKLPWQSLGNGKSSQLGLKKNKELLMACIFGTQFCEYLMYLITDKIAEKEMTF